MKQTIVRQLQIVRNEKASELDRIDSAIAALRKPPRSERRLSVEARERIAAAQRKRWAKVRRQMRA